MSLSKSLFQLTVQELAKILQGQDLELPDGRVIKILKTDYYTRTENEKGSYKPMLNMEPGSVYVARIMNAFLFLIVALEGTDSGACVRVTSIQTQNGIIKGPGRVGTWIGFNMHQQTGRLMEREGKPLLLSMEGVLTPEILPVQKTVLIPITDSVLSKYTDHLAIHFMSERLDEAYEEFLERIKREWITEDELKKRLGIS
ncbi:hypothetical protein HYV70_02535 [Candidatus Uhrbacteria bacterium]|nr:hypothetical protein [Candidatus Uhrbacteria bacterium]